MTPPIIPHANGDSVPTLDVKINAQLRIVTLTIKREHDLVPFAFAVPFSHIKAIAASVLQVEVQQEGTVNLTT